MEVLNVKGFSPPILFNKFQTIFPLGHGIVRLSRYHGFDSEFFSNASAPPSLVTTSNLPVSCVVLSDANQNLIALSHDGSNFNTPAEIFIYKDNELLHSFFHRKSNVVKLGFCPNEVLLAALGGTEESRFINIQNISTGRPHMSMAITGATTFSFKSEEIFILGEEITSFYSLYDNRLFKTDAKMGKVRRRYLTVVCDQDTYFCGTTSGDIIVIKDKRFDNAFPTKKRALFQQGVTALTTVEDFLIVGSGLGDIAVVNKQSFEIEFRLSKPLGSVIVTLKGFVGKCEASVFDGPPAKVYGRVNVRTLELKALELVVSRKDGSLDSLKVPLEQSEKTKKRNLTTPVNLTRCECIKQIMHAPLTSTLMLSCETSGVQIWDLKRIKRLKKIKVKDICCMGVCPSGNYILAGDSAGNVHLYGPESGKELLTIEFAVTAGAVTCVVVTKKGFLYVGSEGGELRKWKIEKESKTKIRYWSELVKSIKEHRARISHMLLNKADSIIYSASSDGTLIGWCTKTDARLLCIIHSHILNCLAFYPDPKCSEEYQILAITADHKLLYLDLIEGELIRSVSLSSVDSDITTLTVNPLYIFIGTSRAEVMVFDVEKCELLYTRNFHAAPITGILADDKFVISSSADGGLVFYSPPAQG